MKYQSALAVLVLVAGCDDVGTGPIEAADQVVIEAFLFAGQVVDDIKLTRTVPLGDDPALAATVDDAVVRLLRGNESWLMTRLSEPGRYGYEGGGLEVRSGDVFRLEVEAFGRIATAETLVPAPADGVALDADALEVPVINVGQGGPGGGGRGGGGGAGLLDLQITVTWENPGQGSYFVDVNGLDPDAESIFPDFIRERIGRFRFRSAPTQEAFFNVGLRVLEDLGPHEVVVYRVNPEYTDLYENRTQDSRDLNEPPSNVTNGLGVFSSFSPVVVGFSVTRAEGQ